MHDQMVLEELTHFDNEITGWITRHLYCDLPLKVHTLGLSWFPNWRTLLRMLYYMAKTLGDGRDLTIKLPAYPHHKIMKPLKLALAGVDDGRSVSSSAALEWHEFIHEEG